MSTNMFIPIFIITFACLCIVGSVLLPVIKRSALRAKGLNATLDEKAHSKLSTVFMESQEKFITALGTGFIVNFLVNQQIGQGFAVVSDKRVYFKGKCYSIQNGKFSKMFEERTVDVKDITGTGYKRRNPTFLLISFIVALVVFVASLLLLMTESEIFRASTLLYFLIGGFVAALVFGPLYMLKRMNLFEISYAGGNIAFDTYLYSKAEIDEFQKQLRLTKDAATINDAVAAKPVQGTNATVDVTNEIKKYAELLDQDLITKEEFDTLKKKLLV